MKPEFTSTNTGDCCRGLEWRTPAEISNDPGQRALRFRIGTHGTFKSSMLRSLSASDILRKLTTREDSDPTIALLDGWAVVLDVLSFYQERLINEGYLRTAQEKLSLFELARHISYRPKPGVAATTWLAFLLDESPGAPLKARIPAGTKVQSVPGQGEQPQLFETREPIPARTEWNAIRPLQRRKQVLKAGTTHLYLQGTDTRLAKGDPLLIVGEALLADKDSQQWELRTVETVDINNTDHYTRVSWQQGLKDYSDDHPSVYALRQRAALFGYNAPDFRYFPEAMKDSFSEDHDGNGWAVDQVIDIKQGVIYLDTVYPTLLPASWLVMKKSGLKELYQIQQVKVGARECFSLANKSSAVTLALGEKHALSSYTLRETQVLAQSEACVLADIPDFTPVCGKSIILEKTDVPLKKDQQLIISGQPVQRVQLVERKVEQEFAGTTVESPAIWQFHPSDGSIEEVPAGQQFDLHQAPEEQADGTIKWWVKYEGLAGYILAEAGDMLSCTPAPLAGTSLLRTSLNQPKVISEPVEIESVTAGEGIQQISLKAPLKHAFLRHTTTVNANISEATHGESKAEVLGSGDGAQAFQQFTLKQLPLTYTGAPTTSGAASSLKVRVNDLLWREVPNFYGRGPREKIFITQQAADGTVHLRFGDGLTGQRLPSGNDNVRTTYRIGTGLEGEVQAGQLSLLLSPQPGVQSVSNPLPAGGAADPEPMEHIRRNAPRTVLTLDRIVSVTDYTHFAQAFAGIGKARADLLWKKTNRCLHLTVASASGSGVPAGLIEDLRSAIDAARHDSFPLVIQSFTPRGFGIQARIQIEAGRTEATVIAATRAALIRAFSFSAREFAQRVTPAEVLAVMQSVAGVLAVDLNELDGTELFQPEINYFHVPAPPADWQEDQIIPATLLTISPGSINISSWSHEDQ